LDTPNQTPSLLAVTDLATDATARKRRFWLRMMLVNTAILLLSPLVGLMGTVAGMKRAFAALSDTGVAEPQQLSSAIGSSLVSTVGGLVIAAIAFGLLVLSVVRYFLLPKPA
jgi:biopolymer transport protein ExbB/TolQ